MLAVNLLASIQLCGNDVGSAIREMHAAADSMETYLEDWQRHVEELDALLGDFDALYILGRGSSMSAVSNGSLNNKEAGSVPLKECTPRTSVTVRLNLCRRGSARSFSRDQPKPPR